MTNRSSDYERFKWEEGYEDLDEEDPIDDGVSDPEIPTIDGQPRNVDYSVVPDNSFLLSGPIGNAPGKGRRFEFMDDAMEWATAKYGAGVIKLISQDGDTRWIIRVTKIN
jgi:hypothetical protein